MNLGPQGAIVKCRELVRDVWQAPGRQLQRWQEADTLEFLRRSLRVEAEMADRLHLVAEEVDPDGLLETGREHIHDAAAPGERSRFLHHRVDLVPDRCRPMNDVVDADLRPDPDVQ